MAKAIKTPLTESVTPFAEIQKLTQGQALEQFVAQTRLANRMFVITAKLMLHLALTVSKGQTVGGLLAKSGIRKTTIDNARQAARVFEEMVLPPEVAFTEAQFDALTFAECLAINRSMSGAAKEKQSAPKIVALMKMHPATWDAELEALTRHGHSCAEHMKIEKAAAVEAAAKAATAATEANAAAIAAAAAAIAPATVDGTTAGTAPGAVAGTPAATTSGKAGKKPADDRVNAATAIAQIEALESVFNTISPIEAAKALPALTELHELVVKLVGTIKPPASRKIVPSGIRKVAAKGKKLAKKKAA